MLSDQELLDAERDSGYVEAVKRIAALEAERETLFLQRDEARAERDEWEKAGTGWRTALAERTQERDEARAERDELLQENGNLQLALSDATDALAAVAQKLEGLKRHTYLALNNGIYANVAEEWVKASDLMAILALIPKE